MHFLLFLLIYIFFYFSAYFLRLLNVSSRNASNFPSWISKEFLILIHLCKIMEYTVADVDFC